MMKSAAILACALASSALLSGCVSTDCGPEPSPAQWQSPAYDASDSVSKEPTDSKSDPAIQKAEHAYWTQVNAIIGDALIYPKQGNEHYCEGTATIRVSIKPDGTVVKVELIHPSGAGYLDREALDVMQRIGRLPPRPNLLPDVEIYSFETPISFTIHR